MKRNMFSESSYQHNGGGSRGLYSGPQGYVTGICHCVSVNIIIIVLWGIGEVVVLSFIELEKLMLGYVKLIRRYPVYVYPV